MKMHPMHSPKLLFRRGVGLILGAGCITSWMIVTSYSWPGQLSRARHGGRVTAEEAARFLQQSTWGPTADLISHVQDVGFRKLLEEQFDAPMSSYPTLPLVPSTPPVDCPANSICRRDNYTLYPVQTRFFTNALYGEDQLRQRVAFALHQIFVVSGVDIGQGYPSRFTPYLQVLDSDAFENFRTLLYDITLNAAMGNYLDMANNRKTNPNENYARELLQLFSIGLNRLQPDGSLVRDVQGQTLPTYDQAVVNAFSRLLTGWTSAPAQDGITNDNGSGVRGDLKAVVKAILLDREARAVSTSQSGHLVHPVLLMTRLARAFNARSADGMGDSDGYLNPQSQATGMNVFSPPSVFSYFSPFGGVPGSSLRGPEFGLLNTSTAVARANVVNTLVFSRIAAGAAYPFNPSGTSLDFSAFQPLAGDPEALVDALNTLMMSGEMSPEMRSAVITAVTAVTSSNSLKRVRTAVYLISTSSQYQVER